MRNGIINPLLLIMAFCFKSHTKYISFSSQCEYNGISESINSDDRNFSSVKPQQFFVKSNILFLECYSKNHTYISAILMLFIYILRIKIKNKCENVDDLDLFLNEPNLFEME